MFNFYLANDSKSKSTYTVKSCWFVLYACPGWFLSCLHHVQMTEIRMKMFLSQYDMKVSQQISQQGTFFSLLDYVKTTVQTAEIRFFSKSAFLSVRFRFLISSASHDTVFL